MTQRGDIAQNPRYRRPGWRKRVNSALTVRLRLVLCSGWGGPAARAVAPSASRAAQRRHHVPGEQLDRVLGFRERQIAERELPDEIVGPRLRHLLADDLRYRRRR